MGKVLFYFGLYFFLVIVAPIALLLLSPPAALLPITVGLFVYALNK